MRNQLLIPLITTGLIGLIVSTSLLSVVVIKQNKISDKDDQFSNLSSEYEILIMEFENLTDCYDLLIGQYQNLTDSYEESIAIYEILLENNTELLDELEALQTSYDNLISDYNDLLDDYNSLLTSFNDLMDDYNTLQTNYDDLQFDYTELDNMYQNLNIAYNNLQADYNLLESDYNILQNDFDSLTIQYNDLLADYNYLQNELDAVMYYLKSLPLCDKMTFYYHICRMYLYPQMGTFEFAKNIILHSSKQANYLSDVDDMLDEYDFWDYGSSMEDAWQATTNIYSGWLSYWSGLNWEEDIFDWIRFTSGIIYQYDSQYTFNRTYWGDYFKFPLEMLNNRAGDCDDFSILGATMFENNGYDVKFATIHDSTYYPGELHHAFLWVNVGEARIDSNRPFLNPNVKWRFDVRDDYDWLIVDLTPGWQDTIWKKPGWLKWYYDNGYLSSDWLPFVDFIDCDPPS